MPQNTATKPAGETTLWRPVFVEHGGKSDVKAAAHYVLRVLDTGEALGSIKLTRPTDVLVERIKLAK